MLPQGHGVSVAHHDRDRFEIYTYAGEAVPDDLAKHVDVCRFTPAPAYDDRAFADLMKADGIDVFMELTGLSPYSGRFAGYRIRKGKATADLTYRVADHHIEASHRVRLRQFELGERVEGQPGFGVPLGLVVALLKDRDGNIDLDVPLTGSLKDPNFHLGQMRSEEHTSEPPVT